MGTFFRPNISRQGRIARACIGVVCLAAGGLLVRRFLWIGLAVLAGGIFALFEAKRGWCLARACGIKTKL